MTRSLKHDYDECGYRIMVIMSGFQPEDTGPIPITRSIVKKQSLNGCFFRFCGRILVKVLVLT